MITVKPAPGKMIRDPVTQQFVDPDKGLRVDPSDTYWRRRLRDGDVVNADAPPPAATTTKATTSKASASGAGATDSGVTQ